MTPQYVLQAEDVAIHYGGVKALDGVAITLEKGQIRGLIGPNGAGKSTVIDAITGRTRLTRAGSHAGRSSSTVRMSATWAPLNAACAGFRAASSAPASLAA